MSILFSKPLLRPSWPRREYKQPSMCTVIVQLGPKPVPHLLCKIAIFSIDIVTESSLLPPCFSAPPVGDSRTQVFHSTISLVLVWSYHYRYYKARFFSLNFLCELKPHAKFQNTKKPFSGRKVTRSERKKVEEEKRCSAHNCTRTSLGSKLANYVYFLGI